jgi:hypothetical protein
MNNIDIQNAVALLHEAGYAITAPKEWEILSVKSNMGSIQTPDKNNKVRYAHFSDCTIEDAISSRGYSIHSVKRLSDGEVFTVGDYIGVKGGSRSKFEGIISGFEIHSDNTMGAIFDTWKQPLSDLKHLRHQNKPPHPHEDYFKEMVYQRNIHNPYDKESQSHCAYEKGFEECWAHFFKHDQKEQPLQDTFQWTDELVKEFVEGAIKVQNSMPHDVSLDKGIRHFKQSKSTPKEDKKVEVKDFSRVDMITKNMYRFELDTIPHIPPEKYPSIKKAIEDILNQ